MRPHRSISERLRSAKSPQAKLETAAAWAADWRQQQEAVVQLLDEGIAAMDRSVLRSAAGQLYEITSKRFAGLETVIRRLTEDR